LEDLHLFHGTQLGKPSVHLNISFYPYNPYTIAPTAFPLNNSYANDISGHPSYGPAFGGNDLRISANCNTHASSIGFPYSFSDTLGQGCNIFTGASTFLVSDIEVFHIK
jgi:hypothetical protein